jgi:hypothetical protein
MATQWPDFKRYTITFKNQEDFDTMIEVKEGFDVVDIGWSDRIINFEDEENRQRFLDLACSQTMDIKAENITLGE